MYTVSFTSSVKNMWGPLWSMTPRGGSHLWLEAILPHGVQHAERVLKAARLAVHVDEDIVCHRRRGAALPLHLLESKWARRGQRRVSTALATRSGNTVAMKCEGCVEKFHAPEPLPGRVLALIHQAGIFRHNQRRRDGNTDTRNVVSESGFQSSDGLLLGTGL